jgi:activating signal cointegrator 1
MKLISLWEPWATLMAIGAKTVETRSWDCNYRGWLAIHASKRGLSKRDLRATLMQPTFLKALENEHLMKTIHDCMEDFPFGKIVAIVRLQSCWPTDRLYKSFPDILTEQERAFGNYEPGRWAWIATDRFRLPEPISLAIRI